MLILVSHGFAPAQARKIKFWDEQRKGANYHNQIPTKEWWALAKEARSESSASSRTTGRSAGAISSSATPTATKKSTSRT